TLMERLKADATDNTSLAEHLSETNFYLGKYYLSLGDLDSATALFKLAVANNVHNFVEHRYAAFNRAGRLVSNREQDVHSTVVFGSGK
ncbi:hypothetical protein ACX3VG_11470, partial [Escherichia coli]